VYPICAAETIFIAESIERKECCVDCNRHVPHKDVYTGLLQAGRELEKGCK